MSIDIEAIQKNAGKLRSLAQKSSRLLNPKQVHRLRTRTRRMEAILEALQLNRKRNERRLLRALAGVRRKAGKVRDMDVLTGALSTVDFKSDKKSVVPLLEFLDDERKFRARKLQKALVKDGSEIRRRLKRTASRLVKLVAGHAPAISPATPAKLKKKTASQRHKMTPAARAKISEAIVRMSDELAVPPALNKSNLHEYRKSVKKLRYVLQAAEEHANDRLIAALGKCKDAIGEWHDWDELVKLANEVAAEDDAVRPAVKKLAAIRQEKFDAALALTNAMRANYVQFEPSAQHRRESRREPKLSSSSSRRDRGANPSPRAAAPPAPAAQPPQSSSGSAANGHRQHAAALHLAASIAE